MSRVRIEFWDNGNNLQEAEAEHIDPHEAFERAVRMARAALPPKPKLEPGQYSMVVNNVKIDPATKEIFMGASAPPNNFTVRIVGNRAAEKGQCQELCREGDTGAVPCRCKRVLGHEGQHVGDAGCAWTGDEPGREQCSERVHWLGVGYPCQKEEGHEGPCESQSGIKWEFGNSIIWCKGKWGAEDCRWGDNDLACRLPDGHEGECGPLPPEEVDCA
jgi:hypothetical protein